MNRELTSIHREVLENLNSTHGVLLRMNRSIQAKGAFGIVKQDRQYRRIVRRGLTGEHGLFPDIAPQNRSVCRFRT